MAEKNTWKKWPSPAIARSSLGKNGLSLAMARSRLEKYGLVQLVIS